MNIKTISKTLSKEEQISVNIMQSKESCYQANGAWCESEGKICKFDSNPCGTLEEILRGN